MAQTKGRPRKPSFRPLPRPRPGPRNLLDAKSGEARTVAIEKANSKASPLLKLPSEIRNRIYEYVFGIGILHIGKTRDIHRRKLPKIVCRAKQPESTAVKDIRSSNSHNSTHLFTSRHARCQNDYNNFTEFWKILDVLRLSRQVHREAALLPYQLNTFYFDNPVHVLRFREALALDQRKAVRSVGLFLDHLGLLNASITLHDMRSLKNLYIFIQTFRYGAARFSNISDLIRQDSEGRDFGTQMLKDLKKSDLDLQSVSVTMYPERLHEQFESVDPFKRWSTRVESKLLEVDDDKVERTKKRTRSGKGYAGAGTKKQKVD